MAERILVYSLNKFREKFFGSMLQGNSERISTGILEDIAGGIPGEFMAVRPEEITVRIPVNLQKDALINERGIP